MKYANMTPEQKAAKLAKKRERRKENPEASREEYREVSRKYRANNLEAERDRGRRYRAKYPHRDRVQGLRKLGFTLEQYEATLVVQNNQCAICAVDFATLPKRDAHADHDHATGFSRGVLCRGCNTGLGMFKDSPERLAAAAAYLKNPTIKPPTQEIK